MSLQGIGSVSAPDVTVQISSENAIAGEKRISPAWSISTLKSKLEMVTGIPPSCQRLILNLPHGSTINLDSPDEDNTLLGSFPLQPYAELQVADTRPSAARPNFVDLSGVEKYSMPPEEYEKLGDSVLSWKRRNQLGRFDPNKEDHESAKLRRMEEEVRVRGIEVGKRCRVGGSELDRRGEIRYVGLVEEIPGGGIWVGIENDEPIGKNDGSVKGKRYFTCNMNHGSFIRPERVEVGNFPVLNDLIDMEEI